MIEKLKNLWADDELRPAGQLLAVFIVVSTALMWWCFPDGSLLGFLFISALLCIPFAFAFNFLTTLVVDQKERLRALEITGIVMIVLGSGMMMTSQRLKRSEQQTVQQAADTVPSPQQPVSIPRPDEPTIARSTIWIGLSWILIYGGYRLTHWSTFRQGVLSLAEASL